ncbi:hypothetical protein VNI00_017722 [Paramarasmius palmivorus]|uniref:Uncharacterized protein n=1 Tax=Paramarasmius palmivorus TaxID=297713 RepID=A0AAW0B7F3_9AGAR
MDLSSDDADFLRTFHVPVLQEFFNRVVEAYPRTAAGLLGSIRNETASAELQLEMAILHNLALFPIYYQCCFQEETALTRRFRDNVDLVVNSFMSHVPTENIRTTLRPQMECPEGDSAPERDLSVATNSQLWATQFVRLAGHVQSVQISGHPLHDCEYDLLTIHWMCTSVADLLSVNVESGPVLMTLVNGLIAALEP